MCAGETAPPKSRANVAVYLESGTPRRRFRGWDKLCPTGSTMIPRMNPQNRPCYGILRLSPAHVRQVRHLWEPVEMSPRTPVATVPAVSLPLPWRRERRPLAA